MTYATGDTLRIATARLEFTRDRRFDRALQVTAVAALVVLVVLIGRHLHAETQAAGTAVSELRRENATLRTDLARARTELELERATRAALTRQVAALNEETTELERRLGFFNDQSSRPRPERRAPSSAPTLPTRSSAPPAPT